VLTVVGGALLVGKMTVSAIVLIGKMRIADLNDEDIVQIFFLAAVGAYTLPILVGGFFDRYLIPLVPFVLYLSAGELRREGIAPTVGKTAAAILITFIAAFAILGTRDYLMWHRVRWEALAELQRTGNIDVHDIDGGFEFNGWVANDLDRLFFNENAKYRIGTSGKPGFTVIKEYEYRIWMPPKTRTLFVLERDAKS
jgi:hypothetical protein